MRLLPSPPSKSRFSLTELLVVIAILAILISMLQPSLRQVLRKGATLACYNNLRSSHAIIMNYSHDHDEQWTYYNHQVKGFDNDNNVHNGWKAWSYFAYIGGYLNLEDNFYHCSEAEMDGGASEINWYCYGANYDAYIGQEIGQDNLDMPKPIVGTGLDTRQEFVLDFNQLAGQTNPSTFFLLMDTRGRRDKRNKGGISRAMGWNRFWVVHSESEVSTLFGDGHVSAPLIQEIQDVWGPNILPAFDDIPY